MSHAREARGEDMVVRGISSASIEEGSVASFPDEERIVTIGRSRTATGQDRNIRCKTLSNEIRKESMQSI